MQANGLNDGFGGYVRGYFSWLAQFVGISGTWSPSIKREMAVWPELRSALVNSLRLLTVATLMGAGGGYLAEVLARRYAGKPVQRFIDRGGLVVASIPVFVTAIAVQLALAVKWGRLPISGLYPVGQSGFDLKQMIRHILLPALVLAIHNVFWYAHRLRTRPTTSIRDFLAGLLESRLWILGSLVVTETVFAYPGVGRFFMVAVQNGDFPQLMPTAALFVVGMFVLHLLLWSPARTYAEATAVSPDDVANSRSNLVLTRMSIGVLAALAVVSALAPWLARYGVDEPVRNLQIGPNQNLSPGAIAWFGTNSAGYDVYSRLFFALRSTLFCALVACAFAWAVAVAAGVVHQARGQRVSARRAGISGIFFVFPLVVVLVMVRTVLGGLGSLNAFFGGPGSLRLTIVVVALVGAAHASGQIHGLTLVHTRFRAPARSDWARVGPPLASTCALAILCESTLSFLGFGPELGSASATLGGLLGESRSAALERHWWVFAFPAALLVLVVLCLNVIRTSLGPRALASAPVAEQTSAPEEPSIEVTA